MVVLNFIAISAIFYAQSQLLLTHTIFISCLEVIVNSCLLTVTFSLAALWQPQWIKKWIHKFQMKHIAGVLCHFSCAPFHIECVCMRFSIYTNRFVRWTRANNRAKMMKTANDWFEFEGHLLVIYAVLGVRCGVNYTHYINTLILKEINQCFRSFPWEASAMCAQWKLIRRQN